MLNDTTKRKINSLRDILVGKVPDPKSQVEQITNALIYKYMDDMDQQAIVFGGKASFFVGEYQKYAWKNLMDPKLGGQDRMNLYTESLEKMSRNKNLSPIFRDILKGAFLPYRSPETLNMFLHEIDGFSYDHSEDLGDAFEYLLAIMGSQGDAGQFRTPRHIIDFIVDVIDPQKNETILDPACGTAGFLISAYKHIRDNNQDKSGASIMHDEMRTIHKNFTGYDISPEMVKLSRVNMFLHNFPEPKIFEYDSLSSDERWDDNFDVILANPPFMTPKGGIIPHKRFSVPANRAEVLFVDYIMNHLRSKGRAGIIVPEGIIFQSGNVYKQLRKNLVEDGLYAVVSLPSGVFAPYSGVKTSILLFNNELAKQKKDILFIKISSDGFDLGAQRKESQNNDLPEALSILDKWKLNKKVKSEMVFYVEKEKIAGSGDYNLSSDRYLIRADYTDAKWPIVELKDVCEITTGKKDVNEGNPKGKYPFFTCARENTFIDNYSFNTEALLIAGNGDVGAVKYYKGKFDAYQRTYILSSFKDINVRYLFHVLNNSLKENMQLQKLGNTMPYIKLGMLQTFKIPLPPLEIQEQLVFELDGYSDIILGAQQILDRWRPKFSIDSLWKIENLNDVCNQITDGTHHTPKYLNEGIPFLRVTDITESNESKKFISEKEHLELIKRCKPEKGDVLYTKNGTIGIAKIVDWNFEFSVFVSLALLKPKNEILNGKYLEHFLNSVYALSQAKAHSKSGTITNLHLVEIRQFKIPVPSLKIQKEIVDKIEQEHKIVVGNKELINIYKQKTKELITGLWKA